MLNSKMKAKMTHILSCAKASKRDKNVPCIISIPRCNASKREGRVVTTKISWRQGWIKREPGASPLTLGVDMDEGEGLAFGDNIVQSPSEGSVAALVPVDGHCYQLACLAIRLLFLWHDSLHCLESAILHHVRSKMMSRIMDSRKKRELTTTVQPLSFVPWVPSLSLSSR